ncbi:MAG: hypothetical protein COB02_02435 [Candidatus Cloacimonadota bacterium]|nr:MAG: hypothetical protein COB02_02435 [Candidatus Cloacimonadota bacterium]
MKLFTLILSFLLVVNSNFAKDSWVRGYTKSNGTVVKGYFRTKADNNKFNNHSTKGHVNPYTGKKGSYKPKTGTWVGGYKKSNGRVVKGYWRSKKDKSKSNNWSSIGNSNPFNGKKGKR